VTQGQQLAHKSSVTKYQLALYSDRLEPGCDLHLVSGQSVLYVRAGTVTCKFYDSAPIIRQSNEVWMVPSSTQLVCEGISAWIDRWTFSVGGNPVMEDSEPLLARELYLGTSTRFLIRCDQVDFPPGGIAYLHTHAGPGIRRLIAGALRVGTGGESNEYTLGDSWFESGPVPVYAEASPDQGASFIRVMVLPIEFQGKSSLTYRREEDRLKPKLQRYSIYVDEEVTL
jgi:quercetin dioxygenase-like cupin family protein